MVDSDTKGREWNAKKENNRQNYLPYFGVRLRIYYDLSTALDGNEFI